MLSNKIKERSLAFRFSLASVLKLRESLETKEEIALQRIQFEVARVRRRIDELTDELAEAGAKRDSVLQRPVHAFRLHELEAEIIAAKEARDALIESLAALKSQRDAQMKLYQAAHTNRQMLSDMLEQQKSLWEQEQMRTQQKQLDDIFASRLPKE